MSIWAINFLDRCAATIPIQPPGMAPVGLMIVGEHGSDRRLLAGMRARSGRRSGFRNHDRMTCRRTESRLQPDSLAMLHYPLRAGMEVSLMLGLGRDTGKADVLAKLLD